jgi:hypothetical protein
VFHLALGEVVVWASHALAAASHAFPPWYKLAVAAPISANPVSIKLAVSSSVKAGEASLVHAGVAPRTSTGSRTTQVARPS